MENAISVRQLNIYVRSLLDGDAKLSCISVIGEISNLKNHYTSGHIYFSLKDKDALIRCVMFKPNVIRNSFIPKDGEQVICTGNITLYEKDGQFQFYVERIAPYGIGDLSQQFMLIKERLSKEGLFNPDTKRPLPKFPKTVAVVTSSSGAALKDIINVVSRRYPICSILVCPVLVQGDGASQTIIKVLNQLYESGRADVIIIGRGGGSIEDLWAFNDENLARTIYESPVPVISAVGHETDFTICDFVADMRAPTPSAAAELAVPNLIDIQKSLQNYLERLNNGIKFQYSKSKFRLLELVQILNVVCSKKVVFEKLEYVNRLNSKMSLRLKDILSAYDVRLKTAVSKLDAVSPLKTLSRGYAVVQKENLQIKSLYNVTVGDNIKVILSDGSFLAEVTQLDKE